MKTNTASAFLLASFACFSVACVNTSSIDDANEAQIVESDSNASADDKHSSNVDGKPAVGADSLVIPPSELPYGASYSEWAAAYWQWVMSIPAHDNPMLDGTCDQNQMGSVFFLAGNTGGSHRRSCTIPRGQGIFIPVFGVQERSCPEAASSEKVCQDVTSESVLHERAASTIDLANPLLRLTVDGIVVPIVESYRVSSDAFADTSPADVDERLYGDKCSGPIEANVCGMAEGGVRDVVSDGYFVMLRQLSDGPHTIEIAANVSPDSSEPAFEVRYDLFVSWAGSLERE